MCGQAPPGWIDAEGVCALEEPLEGFEETVEEHFGGETARADEDFDDAGGCLDG